MFSRAWAQRDIQGVQFLAQSDKHSAEYLIGCINKFLVEIREKARNLSDEDFEVQKQAVYTKKAVKDINLSGMFARMAYEINSNRYMFDSQE